MERKEMKLNEVLENYELGSPESMGVLTVYPILQLRETKAELVDIDEAIEKGWITVTEVSESGSVPELKLVNRSDRTIIIFDGEELVGAKQNRMVNVTIVVAPHSSLVIPVSCVEQGRWSHQSRHFDAGEFAYPSLRRDKFQRVTANLRQNIGHQADQGMVWEEIASKAARMGVQSETGAMRDVADRFHVDDEAIRQKVRHAGRQTGYLAFIRQGFAGGDIFPTGEISRRKFYKLMRSYNLDSLDAAARFPLLEADDVFEQIRSSVAEPVESIGAGEDFRFENDHIQGAVTLFRGRFAHLTVFPKVSSRPQPRMRRRYWVD